MLYSVAEATGNKFIFIIDEWDALFRKVQNDMTTIKSRDDVLTLLVHLGYLAYDIDNKSVCIPNEEIGEEFVRAVTTGKHTCKIEEYKK